MASRLLVAGIATCFSRFHTQSLPSRNDKKKWRKIGHSKPPKFKPKKSPTKSEVTAGVSKPIRPEVIHWAEVNHRFDTLIGHLRPP